MAINFPSSPVLNQTFTDSTSGFTFQWNGTVWKSFSASTTSELTASTLKVTGVSTLGNTVVGGATTQLIVNGDARITGILTIGTSSLTLDGVNNQISIGTGVTIKESGTASFTHGINVTGVVTATSFVGNLTGIVTTASFATTSFNLSDAANITTGTINSARLSGSYNIDISGNAATATYATSSGIATYASNAGVATYADNAGIATYATSSGIATYASNAGIATYATSSGIATYASSAGVATYATSAGLATYSSNAGIATYATNAGIATYASTAGVATALQNARTFEITGDIIASPISFNGTGNVSLAATIQPNSVALGSDTTGDYVSNITGTSNQITVTSGTGEGSTPTLSVPNQFTAPQDVTITRDLQVNRNLNVNGNITIGGTSATLFTTELKISDPDIVLGFRTDALGNDVSNDNTANHGGVALASTEGTPLVDLFIAGIETNPATYKKIMWFKSGTFAGLGTDAWLSNYAVGIGSTQFPIGTRLASGSVQFTQNDLAVVRNINASGVGTITTLSSTNGSITNLTGTGATITNGSITNLTGTAATITTLSSTNGSITNLTGTNANLSGIITASGGFNIGIQSGGLNVTSGVVTALNFVGAGNTFNYNPSTKVIDISISGGTSVSIGTSPPASPSVGSLWYNTNYARTFIYYSDGDSFQWVDAAPFNFGETTNPNDNKWTSTAAGIHTTSNVGIGTTNPTAPVTVANTKILAAGIVTAYRYYGDGSQLTGISASGGGGVSDWRDNSLF